MRGPRPKSLILDLLSALAGGSLPVAGLVEAAGLFRIAEGSLRVALSRLLSEGRVERDERGAYRLGPAAAPVQGQLRGWRTQGGLVRTWRSGWVGVLTRVSKAPRGADHDAARALHMLGFRSFTADLQLRPDNLRGGVAGLRERLVGLGGPAGAPVFGLGDLDADHEARARRLWDRDALERGYREAQRSLSASARRLPDLPEATAMTESFRLGGRVLQQLALDPLLPEALVDVAARRSLVSAMEDYDRLGRAAWRPFLERHGVTRLAEAPAQERWAAA